MIKINRGLRAWTPLTLAIACGALALLWPDWLDELRAQGYAQDLICANITFTGVANNVEVPAGTLCSLRGANVDNVKVFGRLRARTTLFRGNIQAEPGHERITLSGSGGGNTVQGDVQIKGGVGPGLSFVIRTMIQGNLQAEENFNTLVFNRNMIGGDLQVFKNTGVAFGSSAFIGGNTIGGNLQCKENGPPPSVSGAGVNTVGGSKEDQCIAALGF